MQRQGDAAAMTRPAVGGIVIGRSDRQARPRQRARRRKPSRRARDRWRHLIAAVLGIVLISSVLAACGTASAGTGPVTLTFYDGPDTSGATQQDVNSCSAQSHGQYTISYQQLPTASDGQREQLVRRLAAHDSSIDIMALDVTWEPEFAEADWILPWTGAYKQEAEAGTLGPALDTAIWQGQLVAVPDNSNTQLLWYRSDLVPTPPTTWTQMIDDSIQLAKEGKPHLIEIQGAQYEGATVWFNTMLASAGGSVLTPNADQVVLGQPAITALSIMKELATSVAADPSLDVQEENQNRLAMEAGTAAFELNYPFVYPSMKADEPALFKDFKWAPYPEVIPGQPARVTIGGTDLAVSAYSQHASLAFQAALCLRDKASQLLSATVGGLPPTLTSLYSDPAMFADYPFHADILQALENASVRPKTPTYQIVSIDISHLVSPPAGINPVSTEKSMVSELGNALQEKGLIP
jgi:multiple sugar transport system substrate-binding protein